MSKALVHDKDGDLSIRYHGPAFDEHSISARDLAPALLTLSDAAKAASRTLDPDSRMELRVTATQPGSFTLFFILQQVGRFASTKAGQGVTFLSALGLGTVIVEAVKILKNRISHGGRGKEIRSVASGIDDGVLFSDEKVTISYPDGAVEEYSRNALRVADADRFVRSVGKAFSKPFKDDDDANGVEMRSAEDKVDVSQSEADEMARWDSSSNRSVETVEMVVQAVDLSFRNDGKWRLSDGHSTQYVEIADKDFMRRIDTGQESFRKNDIYKVLMKVERKLDKDNVLVSSWVSVEKVLEHRSIMGQPSLF